MGVACSGHRSPRDEFKKPITKEVVVPNGVSNGTLPPKQNNDTNGHILSDITTTKVKAGSPEPIQKASAQLVSKSLDLAEPDVAETISLKHERGDDTPRDEGGVDGVNAEVKSGEDRGTEHTGTDTELTTEQKEETTPEVSGNENNATEETHVELDQDVNVPPQSDQTASVTPAVTGEISETETRGDLDTSAIEPKTTEPETTEPETTEPQEKDDSQSLENNAKTLVAEVISVATMEEKGETNKVETDETVTAETNTD